MREENNAQRPTSNVQRPMGTGSDDISIIRGIHPKRMAIHSVLECYANWKGAATFEEDLRHYLMHGWVLSRPSCFAMAKVIDLAEPGQEQRPAWFVRMAAGDMVELLLELPGQLSAICFCRRNDGKLRIYSLQRLIQKATRRKQLLWAEHQASHSAI